MNDPELYSRDAIPWGVAIDAIVRALACDFAGGEQRAENMRAEERPALAATILRDALEATVIVQPHGNGPSGCECLVCRAAALAELDAGARR